MRETGTTTTLPFVALWRAVEDAFWSKPIDGCSASEMTRRCDPAPRGSSSNFSPMGTRIRFLGWYLHGFGTPPFPTHLSMRATLVGHARAGTREPQQQLRVEETIHQMGPRVRGVLAGRSASGMDEKCRWSRRSAVMPGIISEPEKPRRPGMTRAEIVAFGMPGGGGAYGSPAKALAEQLDGTAWTPTW
jgi:hypothetical protein